MGSPSSCTLTNHLYMALSRLSWFLVLSFLFACFYLPFQWLLWSYLCFLDRSKACFTLYCNKKQHPFLAIPFSTFVNASYLLVKEWQKTFHLDITSALCHFIINWGDLNTGFDSFFLVSHFTQSSLSYIQLQWSFYFLWADKNNSCTITVKGKPANLDDGDGMQFLCTLHFTGKKQFIEVLQKQLLTIE